MKDSNRPLYQQIFDDIIHGIHVGSWKDGDRLASEKELADQYSVSRITSKKALDMLANLGHIQRIPGKGSFVRIGETSSDAAVIGESADVRAVRADANEKRPLMIGLILPDFEMSYGALLISGIEKAIVENGMFLTIRRSNGDQVQEDRSLDDLLSIGVDGVLIIPVHNEYYNPKILRLVLDGFPLVFMDRHLKGLNASFVGTDNTSAAKKATDMLLEAGHRSISFLSPAYAYNTAIEERMEGFVKSHAAHGIAIDETIWLTDIIATLPDKVTPDIIQKDLYTIQQMLQQHKEITCLFATEYSIALLAMEAVKTLGLKIPQDISLLCFDGPHHLPFEHTITHLRQRETDMGSTAVRLLLKQIHHEIGTNENIFLDADLVLGYSTAKI